MRRRSTIWLGMFSPCLRRCQSSSGEGKVFESAFEAGREIVLDDAVAVGGVGELQAEDLGVLLRLAETVGRFLVIGFASTMAIAKSGR